MLLSPLSYVLAMTHKNKRTQRSLASLPDCGLGAGDDRLVKKHTVRSRQEVPGARRLAH